MAGARGRGASRAWERPASVNGVFRGVFVESGARRVEFVYAPVVFTVGLYLSLCAAGIAGGIAGFAATAALRRRGPASVRTR
jgi:hypothetical protein